MEEDAEALEVLFAAILRLYPPGPRRAFHLDYLRQMAAFTRCPQWPLGRDFFVLRIRREAEEARQQFSCEQVDPVR